MKGMVAKGHWKTPVLSHSRKYSRLRRASIPTRKGKGKWGLSGRSRSKPAVTGVHLHKSSSHGPQHSSSLQRAASRSPLGSFPLSSVARLHPTLCDPMNRSTPGLPVHHQLAEFTQTHVHRVGDVIQPSHPLSSPSPPAPNPSQHQGLFK